MIHVIFICIFTFMCSYLGLSKIKAPDSAFTVLLVCVFIFILIVVGFRTADTGVDTQNYISLISESTVEPYRLIEPLSSYLFYWIEKLGDNFTVWLIVLFILMFVFFFFSALNTFNLKYSVFYLLISILFVTYLDLFTNGIRQGLGVGASLLGLSLIKKYDLKSIVYLIPGVLFHYSLFIYLLAYLLFVFLRKSHLDIIFCSALSIFILLSSLVFIGGDLSGNLTSLFDYFSGYLPEFISNKVALSLDAYSDSTTGSFSNFNFYGKMELLISLFIPILFPLMGLKKLDTDKFKMFYILYMFSVFTYLFVAYQPNSYRFYFLSFPLIPFLLTFLPYKSERPFYNELVILVFMLLISFKTILPFIGIIGYNLIFSH